MHLCKAKPADLPVLALIQARAFVDEPIFDHFYPFRHLYPQDYYDALLHDLKVAFVTPGNALTVVVLDEKDLLELSTNEKYVGSRIAGFNSCVRYGKPKNPERWNPDTKENRLQCELLEIEARRFPNRAISLENIEAFYKDAAVILGPKDNWMESLMLATLPEYQHLGVVKLLVSWVTSQAREEGVEIGFEATEVSLPIYIRIGSRVLGHVKLPAKNVSGVELPEISVPVLRLRVKSKL